MCIFMHLSLIKYVGTYGAYYKTALAFVNDQNRISLKLNE